MASHIGLLLLTLFSAVPATHAQSDLPGRPLQGITIDDPVDGDDAIATLLGSVPRGSWNHPIHVRLVASRAALEPAPGQFAFDRLDERLALYRGSDSVDVYLDLRGPLPSAAATPAWLELLSATVARAPAVFRGVIVGAGEAAGAPRPAAADAAYALKAASVALGAVGGSISLTLAGLSDLDSDWLRDLYDQDVAPYLDAVAIHDGTSTARVREQVDARDPTAAVAVLGVPLGNSSESARRLAVAQLSYLGTRVTGVGYAGDARAIDAALPALDALRDLADQPMVALDAGGSPVVLRRDGRDVTATIDHRLLFGFDTGATYFIYGEAGAPFSLTVSEGTGLPPVIRDPAGGDLTAPTAFAYSEEDRVATLTLPAATGPRVVDWNVSGRLVQVQRAGVESTVLPSLAEIVARHRRAQATQDARLERYVADAMMVQHFRPAVPDSGFDVQTENRFYVDDEITEFEELSFRLNGTRWGSDRPPFPLLQAEKVLSVPLDLRLTSDYRYTLEGVERIDGRECFVIRFDPIDDSQSLYRGTVWIDRTTYMRVKVDTVQTRPGSPVLTSQETQHFEVVGTLDGLEISLLRSLNGRQTFLVAGRSLLVERQLEFSGFELNPPAFESRRDAARHSDRVMYRDTARGLRYLVLRDGERVVDDQPTTRAKALLLGVTFDPAYDFPLPLGGLNYLNFDFHGAENQLAVLFGGVLVLVNAQRPNLVGTTVDGSVDLFAIAVPGSDRIYDEAGERPGERVLTIPFSTGLNLGWRITDAIRITSTYQFRFDAFFRDSTTDPEFRKPSSTPTHGGSLGIEWKHRGYSAAATWSGHVRQRWLPWGGPEDYDPGHRTFSRRSASLSKDFFTGFHSVHLNAAYYGGHDLDRFTEYQFGFFDEHRIHGVPSAGVRFAELGMFRASYAFNLFDLYRAEVALDRAYGRSNHGSSSWQAVTGVGVGFLMRGPRQTMLRGDVGKSFLPERYRRPGSFVFQFQILKPL